MGIFDIGKRVVAACGDPATYNGKACKAFVDHDVELEADGDVYICKHVVSVDSSVVEEIKRGDTITFFPNTRKEESYTVKSLISDDDDMKELEVSRL